MIASNILATLLAYNPWIEDSNVWDKAAYKHLPHSKKHPYVRRFEDHRVNWPQRGTINLVVGPRQCGKSTLIWNTLLCDKQVPVYINCNEFCMIEWCQSPVMFWEDLKTVVKQPKMLFFDEIQHVKNAALFLKGLADLNNEITIFATATSLFNLQDKLSESLAGRVNRIRLLPFSLKEWMLDAIDLSPALMAKNLESKFQRMVVFGSYPEVWFSSRPDLLLNNLVESFVVRDASNSIRIRFPAKFRRLLATLASQIGNLVNYSHLASICGLDVKTATSYTNTLQEQHVIKLIPPFVGGKRAEIKNAPKVFFIDNGIRNLLISQFNAFEMRGDREILFENLVFSELEKISEPLNSVLSSLHIINGGIMQNKGVVVRTHRSLTNCND